MKHRGHFLRQYGDSSHRLLVTDENQQKAEGKGEEAELESSRTFTETECLDQRIFRRGSSERCKKGKCRSDWLHWPNDCTIRWTTMMTTTTTCLQQQLWSWEQFGKLRNRRTSLCRSPSRPSTQISSVVYRLRALRLFYKKQSFGLMTFY